MTLCTQVIDLIGLRLLHDPNEITRISQITVMQDKIAMINVRVLVEMINAIGIKKGCAAFNAMNDVAFFKQELC